MSDRLSETVPPSEWTPTRSSFADAAEIDDFVAMLGRFERREIDAEGWRAYRVVRGAYSQRQEGVHMLRVKLPQGVADARQLRALADVAESWSRGFGHVTTRQNFQFHFVRPRDLEPALRRLADVGITTAGAGGNAVRNVVACPLAGVAEDEAFDVTPYAEAVTRHFLRHPLASSLPRKFKIAFEGCAAEDHVATPIHDLGFRARVRDEGGVARRGFSVTVAGGTSSLCTSGASLYEFLPASDVLTVIEAAVRVFHARGDRQNKQRNRLKFLVRQLGFDAFRELLDEEIARLAAQGAPRLPFHPEALEDPTPPQRSRASVPEVSELAAHAAAALPSGRWQPLRVDARVGPPPGALAAFLRTNVRPQRQAGYVVVTVAPPQGDLTAAQLRALAELALAYGDGTVRLASRGHVHLRWIRADDVAALFPRLAAAGLGRAGAGGAADVVSCPGSEVCRLAVTHTRGVARFVEDHVRSALRADAVATPFSVHVSGCPNGCSQHHIAAVGLQGGARRVNGAVVPQYFVLAGGGVEDGKARFGSLVGKVPARRASEAVARLAALYAEERRHGERPSEFFGRALDRAKQAIAPLEALGDTEVGAEDLVEPGAPEPFRPDTQEGECAA